MVEKFDDECIRLDTIPLPHEGHTEMVEQQCVLRLAHADAYVGLRDKDCINYMQILLFLPRDATHSAVQAVIVCPSVRLSVTLFNSPPTCSPLSPSITHSLFHSRLKIYLFHKYFPPQSASSHLDCLLGLYWTGLTLLNGFSFLVIFSFLFWVVRQTKLA